MFICEVRNSDRYQMLAENMTDGQSMQQDAMAESLMESNSRLIMFDTQLHQLVITDTTPQRVANVEKYLVDKYFDGFWDKYEVDVQILPHGHPFRVRKSAFGACEFFIQDLSSLSASVYPSLVFISIRVMIFPQLYWCF